MQGAHLGRWMFGAHSDWKNDRHRRRVAFEYDGEGQIANQWFCTNFVRMIEQLGGRIVAPLPSDDRPPVVAATDVMAVASAAG